MDNTQEINYSVVIKNNPGNETISLINSYWSYNKGEFINKPKLLANEKNISLYDLILTIKEYSHVDLECNCGSCNETLKQEVTSQTQFISILKNLSLCKECIAKRKLKEEEEKRKLIEIRRKEHELAEIKYRQQTAFNSAIERYKETRIHEDEARFMIHFINTCPNRISLSYYNENYLNFYKLKLLELIHIEENFADEYAVISYPEELKDLLVREINKNSLGTKPTIANTWSRLSFLLEKNKTYRNIHTPRFSGTLLIKEDVYLEKGTKCLYGVWDRDHNDAWLTLTPTSDIIVAKNTPIHKEPEHIRDLLNRFLDNPENRDY
ncbi:hypothetical protein SAMN05192545_2536 [Maribacter dokdonensis]|uniref:RAMA domain-containing protein n=1 Tax=Maribacter dokdonensis TaxID=320912 RepID=A0ABY0UPM3_9FLAO|nr:hypothetical protein [Maribacter dokdonensis]SDS99942.1 hypothetical protein SAMN05192545_2536 [Maribacter dokdonensis]